MGSAPRRDHVQRRPQLTPTLHLVSLAAGAAIADVSVRTLRRYIAQGR
jgi:hypothetical protein